VRENYIIITHQTHRREQQQYQHQDEIKINHFRLKYNC